MLPSVQWTSAFIGSYIIIAVYPKEQQLQSILIISILSVYYLTDLKSYRHAIFGSWDAENI